MQIEMEYIEWGITFGILKRRDSKNKHIIKDEDGEDRMNDLWYDKPSKLSKDGNGEVRMNNLWDVEEDGNGDDRKEVSEETSTVWSGVHQDL